MSELEPEATEEQACRVYLTAPASASPAFLPMLDTALAACDAAALRCPAGVERATMSALQAACAGRTAFLVEDVALALEIGADGVHLSDPAGVRDARARLGAERILGASCDGSRHAAMLAGEDGADYIAFGETGRALQPSLIELIAWWNELFVLPCLAEAAFDEGDCARLAAAGADFVGLGEALWQHPDGAEAGLGRVLEAIARESRMESMR